jgi:hypothetical protein
MAPYRPAPGLSTVASACRSPPGWVMARRGPPENRPRGEAPLPPGLLKKRETTKLTALPTGGVAVASARQYHPSSRGAIPPCGKFFQPAPSDQGLRTCFLAVVSGWRRLLADSDLHHLHSDSELIGGAGASGLSAGGHLVSEGDQVVLWLTVARADKDIITARFAHGVKVTIPPDSEDIVGVVRQCCRQTLSAKPN